MKSCSRSGGGRGHFLIPLLYLVFRGFARARAALLAAVLVASYWFAFIHSPFNPFVALVMCLVDVLAMAYLWLRRDLKTVIGFHFCMDFVAAYLFLQGLWFG